ALPGVTLDDHVEAEALPHLQLVGHVFHHRLVHVADGSNDLDPLLQRDDRLDAFSPLCDLIGDDPRDQVIAEQAGLPEDVEVTYVEEDVDARGVSDPWCSHRRTLRSVRWTTARTWT